MSQETLEIEEPKGKKTNIIVTYEELRGIHLMLAQVNAKMDHLAQELHRQNKEHMDHEIRLRALELSFASNSGGSKAAQWATPVLIAVGGFVLSILNYLK